MGHLLAAGVPWEAAATLTPAEAEVLLAGVAAARREA